MRPGAEYPMGHGPAASASASVAPSSSAATLAPRSPWQSPIPYLFSGLAAMLGLIALSLLALACSYWKLSGILSGPDGQDGAESRADGEKGSAAGEDGPAGEWRGHVVVIMAGNERPTFLATPASNGAVDAVVPGADVAASCGACGSEERKNTMVECEASAQPAGSEDDAQRQSRSERTSRSPSSVISGT